MTRSIAILSALKSYLVESGSHKGKVIALLLLAFAVETRIPQ